MANCVYRSCEAIVEHMLQDQMPALTEATWRTIAEGFWQKWNFPNCLGALDGKHIVLQAPRNSGSSFFNYKKSHSIVLLALVDADYKFRVVQVGDYGRGSDSGIYAESRLGKRLEAGTMHVPRDTPLPGADELGRVPFVVVGDAAFPLRTYLMRPYPGKNLPREKEVFNYRLSRARMVVECAFGILAARWRALHTKLNMLTEQADNVVLSMCILHNFLLTPTNARRLQMEADELGRQLVPIEPVARRAGREAYEVRERFATFFNGRGRVPWQGRVVNRGRLGQGGA